MATAKISKPNIEEVFLAFQSYQNLHTRILSKFHPGEYDREFKKNQEALKAKLEGMGLAQHIDWSDKQA